jgi:thiol-disulfide isomerase/thioredoxin
MKRFLFTLLLTAGFVDSSFAANGYNIQIKFNGVKDSLVYLAHYFGEPLPTIYQIDSARFDKNGNATLKSTDETLGGIYILLLSDKQTYMEFLLNNGDNMQITADIKDLPATAAFKNAPENERFAAYVNHLLDYAKKQAKHTQDLATAKTKADTAAISKLAGDEAKEVTAYRRDYVTKYPGTLLANIFNALEVPQVPSGKHLLPNGATDSNFSYHYYKEHYWDKFDFKDDRLIHTPIYDGKLDEYVKRLVEQTPDSLEKEADMLLAKTRGSKNLFKYTLHWFTKYVQNSKIMGLDEVFVYLVENYHMKGDADWLSEDMLAKYIDRARKIAPNVIGNVAPDIKMIGLDKKQHNLYDVNSKYTLLIFWSPECGACLKEVPKMDSVYEAALKKRGVKVYAVRTEGEEKEWQETIDKFKINDWVNVYDPEHKSNYRAQYDVYATPVTYLIDDKHIIRGKRLAHDNLVTLLDILDKKQKENN